VSQSKEGLAGLGAFSLLGGQCFGPLPMTLFMALS